VVISWPVVLFSAHFSPNKAQNELIGADAQEPKLQMSKFETV
jgi:hypothetical protein